MAGVTVDELRKVNSFPRLVELLRDKLEWPIGDDFEFEDVVFEYEPGELNLKPEERAKVREIHQLRPLVQGQPWGIFFISFEEKSISVTVLRRLLRGLVLKNRASARESTRQAWDKRDLIFAANFGKSGERELAIVHFADEKETNDLPVLKVLGWNAKNTVLHNDHIAQVLSEKLRWPDNPGDHETWRGAWSGAFETRHNEVVQTSKDLAIGLASLATDIRARANQLLAAEADDGTMRKLLEAFRKNMIQDLDEDGFADMFAQTIAYGLLAARISRPSGALVADNLTDMVPKTNPFLRELFETFLSLGGRDKRKEMDFDELGVRNVVDMLARANMDAVLRDFGDRNPKEDPVIHFYELFLKEYDPQKRMQRGVFYTPRPVVNFIVRGVDEVLRTEFGLPLGLADTTTWAELAAHNDKMTIPEHVDPGSPFVQILDPATGTGTFLVEVIDIVYKHMMEHWRSQKWSEAEILRRWNEYVPSHLLPRLTGFELMMAPYAIAHMKIGLKLVETGYKFGSDERAHVFLTNALEPPRNLDMEFIFMSEALAHEAQAANAAKSRTLYTVVVGNPPYSLQSANLTATARSLILPYKIIDGTPIKERGALQLEKILQDDYIKFVRISQSNIDRASAGIIALVCNHSILSTTSLRGARRSLLNSFNQLNCVDLHGNSARKEAADSPTGDDQNIFDIKQGVAILTAYRFCPNGDQNVLATDLWGARERKLERLLRRDVQYTNIKPRSPNYFFCLSLSLSQAHEYSEKFVALNKIFNSSGMGIVTARDNVAVSMERSSLISKAQQFRESSLSDAALCAAMGISLKKGWDIEKARRNLAAVQSLEPFAVRFCYRPFDRRYIFYHQSLVWGMSRPTMQHMIAGDNIGLGTSRHVEARDYNHAFAFNNLMGHHAVSLKEVNHLFPLWVRPSSGEAHRRPNIDRATAQNFGASMALIYEDGIVRVQQASMGAEYRLKRPEQLSLEQVAWDGRGDFEMTFGPRDLFDWVYAVLHSPGYRTRYAEFLKSDFPRIPPPGSRELFAALTPHGARLVSLHFLTPDEAPILESPDIRFAGQGEARVELGYPKYENGKVMINANRWFEDVPKETWEFRVGDYQVCEKWLRERAAKGGQNPKPARVLTEEDILHYRRVVVALSETRRIMAEIDSVIDEHGGWPRAFSSHEA